MSGVGKSHLSCKLAEWGWKNYSCDYLIGTKYLSHLVDDAHDMREDDISWLSDFVGRLGARDQGGIAMSEFKLRQKLYYNAEVDVVRDAGAVIDAADGNIVIDSSGSLCEVEDESVIAELGARSVFVYLKVRQEGHAEILARASSYPKPLYFPPKFLEERYQHYIEKFDLSSEREIDPQEFLRWIFPHLFEARLPKYQKIADAHGVTLPSHVASNVESADELFELIAEALDER